MKKITTKKLILLILYFLFTAVSNAQSIKEQFDNQTSSDSKSLATHENTARKSGLFKGTGSNAKYTNCECELSGIYESIEKHFNIWQKKGEFEKEEAYKKRLLNESRTKFSALCKDVITSYIKAGYYDEYSCQTERNYAKFKTCTSESYAGRGSHCLTLQQYDSEKEQFPVKITLGDFAITGRVHVYIAEAPQFKKDWRSYTVSTNVYDYYLYEGYLLPTKLQLSYSSRIINLNIPVNILTPVRIYFDDLEILNPYLTGYYYEF